MSTAALQGLWTYRARNRQTPKAMTEVANNYLVDTCRVWRKDGPLLARLAKDFDIA